MPTKEKPAAIDLEVATAENEQLAVAEPEKEKAPPRSFLQKSVAELEDAIAHYPETIRSEVIYAQGYCREMCRGNLDTFQGVAEKLGLKRSRSYFSNFLQGYYFRTAASSGPGVVATWCEFTSALRRHEVAERAKLGFLETPTYICFKNFVLERWAPGWPCKFGGVVGPTGSQKSKCARHFRDTHNHTRSVYFEAPARMSLVAFQRKLAAQYNAQIGNNAVAREERIRENVREDRCIIIDNVQRLYHPSAGSNQPIFNYLLELQDDTGCTIILIFTEEFLNGDLTAGRAKGYFEQFVGRWGGENDILRLPPYATKGDLRCIARHFGLRESVGAMERLTQWSKLPGRIRIVFARLRRAQQFALLDGRERITLADLDEAHDYVPPSIGDDQEDEGGAS